jgi:DNA-binding NarL/FixJ family response regulator
MRNAPPPGLESAETLRRRVAIIDDHDFFAACLRAVLDSEPDLEVCDVATECGGLYERVQRVAPDLLVVDLSLGAFSGITLARRLRAEGIEVPILFVSTTGTPSPDALVSMQPCAFIPKTRTPAQLLAAIRGLISSSYMPACPASSAVNR